MTQQMTDYFLARTGEKSARAIAARTGIDPSVMNRQLNGSNELKVQTVVAIARAYSLSIGELFAEVGFITPLEASLLGIQQALEAATEEQLLSEMLRRVAQGKASSVLTGPVSDETLARVVQLRSNDSGYIDDALTGLDTAAGTDETQADEDE